MTDLKNLAKRAEEIRRKYDELNALNGKETWRIRDYAMGMAGDYGDLMKLVMAKENLRDIDDVDSKLGHELADCLWSLLIIAAHYGIDLNTEFEKTMQTIEKKIERASA